MSWYLYSLIALFAFTVMFFTIRALQKTYPIDVYLFYIGIGTTLYFAIASIGSRPSLSLEIVLILTLAGIAVWFGNYAYNVGIRRQPNLGYVEAVSSTRLIVLYLVSLILFNAPIELLKLIGIIGIVSGVILVVGSAPSDDGSVMPGWFGWTLTAGLMFALPAIASRYANDAGVKTVIVLLFVGIVSTILFGISSSRNPKLLKPRGDVKLLILATAASIIGNAALFSAYETTPNLAYPTAINSSRMVLLFLGSVLLYKRRLEVCRLIGVLITFLSVLLLA